MENLKTIVASLLITICLIGFAVLLAFLFSLIENVVIKATVLLFVFAFIFVYPILKTKK
jgi:hypothetical protein